MIGDVVTNSWGYDQTNVDFYRVVKTSAHFVWLQPIAGTLREDDGVGPMSGYSRPDADVNPIRTRSEVNFRSAGNAKRVADAAGAADLQGEAKVGRTAAPQFVATPRQAWLLALEVVMALRNWEESISRSGQRKARRSSKAHGYSGQMTIVPEELETGILTGLLIAAGIVNLKYSQYVSRSLNNDL